jgi:hypothetical protein
MGVLILSVRALVWQRVSKDLGLFVVALIDRDVPRKPRLEGGVPAYREAGRGTI